MLTTQTRYSLSGIKLWHGVFLILLSSAVIIFLYAIAEFIPVTFGWENGVFENLQALLLGMGALWALARRTSCTTPDSKGLWLTVIPLWIVLLLRELSWGAVFYTPLAHSDLTGPAFSSSVQLWYKPLVAPALILIMAWCAWVFIRTKQYRTVATLWRRGNFPLIEIVLIAAMMTLSAIAEGHLGLSIHLSKGAYQVFEEGVEVWTYCLLLIMQYRVIHGTIDLKDAGSP